MLLKRLCGIFVTLNSCNTLTRSGSKIFIQSVCCHQSLSPYSSAFLNFDLDESNMATNLERIKARALETESILSTLQNQIEAIRKAAVKQAGLPEEHQLMKENETLKKEIGLLKSSLILAEIANGVRQIHVPSKEAAVAVVASSTKAVENSSSNSTHPKQEAEVEKPKEEKETPAKKAKTEKKGKDEGNKAKTPKQSGTGDGKDEPAMDISRLDMRVGKIVEVEKHPDADTLYVEKVDLGEGKIRTIVSGLVKQVPLSAMQNRVAVFMCNLKPVKMRGIFSEGMIMCALSDGKVEILVPPATASIGDRVTFKEYPGQPDVQLNPKKKIWETLKPDVRTNKDKVATYKGAVFNIDGKGIVVAPTLADAQIS